VKGSSTLLYAGCLLPDQTNLYIVGTGQVRYGFGPLVTPGADLVARMIELQEQMELPLGLVFKEMGYKLPRTHLVDPHASLRRMRMAPRVFPPLLRKERQLREKYGHGAWARQKATNGGTNPATGEGTDYGTSPGSKDPRSFERTEAPPHGNPNLEVY